jgi:hypothetical protein
MAITLVTYWSPMNAFAFAKLVAGDGTPGRLTMRPRQRLTRLNDFANAYLTRASPTF